MCWGGGGGVSALLAQYIESMYLTAQCIHVNVGVTHRHIGRFITKANMTCEKSFSHDNNWIK